MPASLSRLLPDAESFSPAGRSQAFPSVFIRNGAGRLVDFLSEMEDLGQHPEYYQPERFPGGCHMVKLLLPGGGCQLDPSADTVPVAPAALEIQNYPIVLTAGLRFEKEGEIVQPIDNDFQRPIVIKIAHRQTTIGSWRLEIRSQLLGKVLKSAITQGPVEKTRF